MPTEWALKLTIDLGLLDPGAQRLSATAELTRRP